MSNEVEYGPFPHDLFTYGPDGPVLRLEYVGPLPAEAEWYPEAPHLGYPHLYRLVNVATGDEVDGFMASSEGAFSAYDMALHLARHRGYTDVHFVLWGPDKVRAEMDPEERSLLEWEREMREEGMRF